MGKTIRDEDLKLNVIVNGDKAKKELGELEVSTRELKDENKSLRLEKKKLNKEDKDYKETLKRLNQSIKENNTQIAKNDNRMDQLRRSIGLTGLTYSQLRREQQKLRVQISNSTYGTPQWKKLNAQLKKVEARMTKVRARASASHFSIKKMADGFSRYFGIIAAGTASIAGFVFSIQRLVDANAKLSDSFADVRKTTGMTGKEVRLLYKDLKKIDTRTGNKELLELARIAGKLGVEGRDNVLGFVRAANQINVALSEDLGGNAEESIRQVGKLVDLFKVKDEYGLEEGLMKVGSAINALGANSTANEQYIIEFTKRIGGIAPNARISVSDSLGLAATLDQLGQTAEVSSTVFGKLIIAIGKDLPKFARMAGLSLDEFTELLHTDANQALIKVLEGARSTKGGIEGMAESLEKLGLDGQRSVGVIGVLTNNIDLLREQQKLANEEFEKGTSLTEEYDIKNNNLAARIIKLRKEFYKMITMQGVQDFIRGLIDNLINLVKWVKENTDVIKAVAKVIVIAVQSLLTYKIAAFAATQATRIASTASKVYGLTVAMFTGRIKGATVAMRAFNFVTKMNPIGLLVSVVTTAASAFYLFKNRVNDASEAQKAFNKLQKEYGQKAGDIAQAYTREKAELDKYYEVLLDNNKSMSERNELFRQFTDKYGNYLKNLDTEVTKIEDLKEAYDDLNAALLTSIVHKSQQQETERLVAEYVQTVAEFNKYNEQLFQGAVEWNSLTHCEFKNEMLRIEEELRKLPAKYEQIAKDVQESLGEIDFSILWKKIKKDSDNGESDNGESDSEYRNAYGQTYKEWLKKQKLNDHKVKDYLNNLGKAEAAAYRAGQEEFFMDEEDNVDDESEYIIRKWKETLDGRRALTEAFYQAGLISKEEYLDRTKELDEEEIEDWKSKAQKIIGSIQTLGNMWKWYADYKNQVDQIQLQNEEKAVDRRKKALKSQLDQGIISQEYYYKRVEAMEDGLEEKRAQVARNQAKREKASRIFDTIINTAAAVVKALPNIPLSILVGVMGAAQTALIAAQPIPQAYKGKYPVRGKDDNKTYLADYSFSPETGLLDSPTLLAGEQPEIIIDPKTTRNLQMNYPGVIQAIMAARVPQYASGSYPREIVKESNTIEKPFTDPSMISAMNNFSNAVDKLQKYGVRAKIDKDYENSRDFREMLDDYDELLNDVNL